MNKFTTHTGLAVPLYQANIDTDQIIPKQFLKSIKRTGFGRYLFYDWRFMQDGDPNDEFVLNQKRYDGASILLAGPNFGCGSSREHAPWSLTDFGFRAIIAPSFADIFYSNSIKNGLLPIVLGDDDIAYLVQKCAATKGYKLRIDLEQRRVYDDDCFQWEITIDDFDRHCLLNALDQIGLTLLNADKIDAYELNNGYS